MNCGPGSFAYAQARMQARLGQRITIDELPRARAARDLGAYLQQVRSTALARHVARIAPGLDVHEVERRLWHEWRTAVEEVAGWQPERWRAAMLWLRWLPYLPALQKLARGGRAPDWTRDDLLLARVVANQPGRRASGLGGTVLEPLQLAIAAHDDVTTAWLTHWRSLWPHAPATATSLERMLRSIAESMPAAAAAGACSSTDEALRALGRRLLRSFRRHPLSPVGAFAYVGLVALDLLELRGAISTRVALG